MEIYQGDSFNLEVALSLGEDNFLTPEVLEELEITLGSLTKNFSKKSILFNKENLTFLFPLSQKESFLLSPGKYQMQVRLKIAETEEVYGMELESPIIVRPLISKEVI